MEIFCQTRKTYLLYITEAAMKKIVLTGGGTAGHVTPNIALLPALREEGFEISYIGSYQGIERQLVEDEGIPYYGIASGKLRRYFDMKNLTDPFRVGKGFVQARHILKKIKPDILFSKGGFVSVPVVRAAAACHIPVLIHESDMTPGLANRLAFPAATKVCCNFPETVRYLPRGKGVLTGTPIRTQLLCGDKERGRAFCGFTADKPVLLIIGGSQGSVAVNTAVRRILPSLLETFQVLHLCGAGNLDESLKALDGYAQYEYIKEELPDLFALSDVVVSRAGANAICELLALRKSALLIPLPLSASRGDQILNARSFEQQGFAKMLEEEKITDELLLQEILDLYEKREQYQDAMAQSDMGDSIGTIMKLIRENMRQ